MDMRIGGLASGIDTDTLVKDLMRAERMPLTKMEQEMTTLEWQRDKYREINTKIDELKKSLSQVTLSSTFNNKSVSSNNESAVTAVANADAYDGNFTMKVDQLAKNEILSYRWDKDEAENFSIPEDKAGTYSFFTYDKNGARTSHSVELANGDSLDTVLRKITNASENRVRAYYAVDEEAEGSSGKMIFESSRTGVYNMDGGNEIDVSQLLTDLGIGNTELEVEQSAQDAKFEYNGFLNLSSKDNSYQLNGVTFRFHSETNEEARINITSDVNESIDKIQDFLDKYNEFVEILNGTQQEERYRDFPPLTDEQKKEMEENEIELWEEKAKSGLLKNDDIISSALVDIRQNWFKDVENEGKYSNITDIGISTTKNWLDGGKLEINPKYKEKLETALKENPADVQELFSNDNETGLIDKLEKSLNGITERIEERAGKGSTTLRNYTIGKEMHSLQSQIDAFEERMIQTENRYWSQFTAMEKAISRMNNQSTMLMSFSAQ